MKKLYTMWLLVSSHMGYLYCSESLPKNDTEPLLLPREIDRRPVEFAIERPFILTYMCQERGCHSGACHQGKDYCHIECTELHKVFMND